VGLLARRFSNAPTLRIKANRLRNKKEHVQPPSRCVCRRRPPKLAHLAPTNGRIRRDPTWWPASPQIHGGRETRQTRTHDGGLAPCLLQEIQGLYEPASGLRFARTLAGRPLEVPIRQDQNSSEAAPRPARSPIHRAATATPADGQRHPDHRSAMEAAGRPHPAAGRQKLLRVGVRSGAARHELQWISSKRFESCPGDESSVY